MNIGIMISIMLILLGTTFVIISFKSITSKWAVLIGFTLFIVNIILFMMTFKGVLFT